MASSAPGSTAPRPGNATGLWERLYRFSHQSYAGDYLGLLLLLAAYAMLHSLAEPFHKLFRLDDPRIQFPHAEVERVDVLWLSIYAALVPLTIIIAWAALFRFPIHKSHVTILGLAISILLTCFLTDMLKNAVGRPRPDLLARCKPRPGTPEHELVDFTVCTETDHHVLHDGWRSWPSGHSSFAFSGLGWLAIFFASQTHAMRPQASLTLALLCLAPLVGAALIAISRLENYRHDVFDVVSGSLLGFLVTYGNWKRYYPGLLEADCDEPHPAPSLAKLGGTTADGFRRVGDEEEGLAQGDEFRFGNDDRR